MGISTELWRCRIGGFNTSWIKLGSQNVLFQVHNGLSPMQNMAKCLNVFEGFVSCRIFVNFGSIQDLGRHIEFHYDNMNKGRSTAFI